MDAKNKAEKLVTSFLKIKEGLKDAGWSGMSSYMAKQCANKSIEAECYMARELLFNLRASHVIENENVYLARIQNLIDLEKQVKSEIEKL